MAEIVYRAERVSVSASQLAAWHATALGSTLRLSGACAACRHPVTAVVSLTGTALENLSAPVTSALTVAISCNCGHEHKGRSQEPIGCGRTWTALAAADASGAVSLRIADDPYLSDAAEAWRASQTNQLEKLRAAAERWIAGVSALLGLLTVLGFGLGASQIRMLTFGGKLAIVAAVAVILGSGGFAVMQAYRAAYGWPRIRTIANDTELLAWYAHQGDLPALTATRLRTAAISVSVALVALMVAVGLTWFLPVSTPSGPMVKVTLRDQSMLCGTLLGSQTGGTLYLRRADTGAAQVVAVTQMVRVTPVQAC